MIKKETLRNAGLLLLLVVYLLLVVFFLATSAPAASAQEKFRFEVGYNGLGHRTTFEYPNDRSFVSGTSFSGNGLHLSGSVKLPNMVSIGARFDHNFLSNPTFFEITRKSERYEPNFGEQQGSSQRIEAFLGLQVLKVGTFEVGVTRHHFGRHWVYFPPPPRTPSATEEKLNSYWDSIGWGPVIGLTSREVRLGSFALGGGVWGYPRMVQNQEWSSEGGVWKERSETASGIKLEATGSYRLSERTTVKAGYQLFRMAIPDPVQIPGLWQTDTVRTEHAVIARYVVTF